MAGQTPINRMNGYGDQVTNGSAASAVHTMHGVTDVRRLLADLTELGELQIRLFSADVRATRQRATGPVVLVAIGAAIVLGSVPVLLLSAADALQSHLGWQAWLAHLIAGGAGVLCGLLALAVAYRKFAAVTGPIERSTTELAKSLTAIRQMLAASNSRTTSEGKTSR